MATVDKGAVSVATTVFPSRTGLVGPSTYRTSKRTPPHVSCLAECMPVVAGESELLRKRQRNVNTTKSGVGGQSMRRKFGDRAREHKGSTHLLTAWHVGKCHDRHVDPRLNGKPKPLYVVRQRRVSSDSDKVVRRLFWREYETEIRRKIVWRQRAFPTAIGSIGGTARGTQESSAFDKR